MDYENIISKKAASIKPSGIRKFFDLVAEMPDAISLGVGEPDFVTPWEIRDAAIKSVQKGFTAYTSNRGLAPLLTASAEFLSDRYNLKYDPRTEVMITVGASEAIDLALRATINDGDEVIVPEPSYVSYAPAVILAGGTARAAVLGDECGFKLTADSLLKAITKKTKALILPYPNNPTGAIMTRAELEPIAKIVKEKNLLVISDEIYSELTYGGEPHAAFGSLPEMRERTVTINGFSKAFAMTGWRVGIACAPAPLLSAMLKIHQYAIMCAPTAGQHAALAALKTGKETDYSVVAEMRQSYDMRRRFLVDALNKIGLKCFEPKGAFYVFPSVKSTGLTGDEFAEKLLKSQKVAVVPGSAFGESGLYHIRCCYACSMHNLQEATKKIERFLK